MSACRSDIELLKTETSYFPSNSIKVLLDNPAISAASPEDNFRPSYNFAASSIVKSYSDISTLSGTFICIVRMIKINRFFKFNDKYGKSAHQEPLSTAQSEPLKVISSSILQSAI